MINTELTSILQCNRCAGPLESTPESRLKCRFCQHTIEVRDGIPLFTLAPANIQPSPKLQRGPEVGTPWRKANWRFLQAEIARQQPEAWILDVGAGRGDFADLFGERTNYIALDIYPYPEVDLVCDLSLTNPFQPGTFDAILLMNVLEHVYDGRALVSTLGDLLKPGGRLIIAIPFMVKMHQVPVDFARYTHYALQRLGAECGLQISHLEGYYDPLFFLAEGLGNLRHGILPAQRGWRHYTGRALLGSMDLLARLLGRTLGPGKLSTPDEQRSLAPTGYHIVYSRPA